MKLTKILPGLSLLLLFAVPFFLLVEGSAQPSPAERKKHQEKMFSLPYTLDADDAIGLADGFDNYADYFAAERPFSGEVINRHTFAYFKHLQRKFRSAATLVEHYDQVKAHLQNAMTATRASQMLGIYIKLTEYELNTSGRESEIEARLQLDEDFDDFAPAEKKLEYGVKYVRARHQLRREYFGEAIADAIFGQAVKEGEYRLRKQYVSNDPEMYGAEKEARLEQYKNEIYGAESANISKRPALSAYKQRLRLYARDLREMPAEQRLAKQQELREALVPKRARAGVSALAVQREQRLKTNQAYKARRAEIEADASLNASSRLQQIHQLQNEVYGKQANAIRQAEAFVKKSMAKR